MLQFNSMRVWIDNEYEKLRGFPKESHFLEGERKSPPQSTRNLLVLLFMLFVPHMMNQEWESKI